MNNINMINPDTIHNPVETKLKEHRFEEATKNPSSETEEKERRKGIGK